MKNAVSAVLLSLFYLAFSSQLLAQCNASFEFEYIPNTFQVHFIDHSTSEHDIVSWHWLFGDGTESDDQSPTHTYPGPGTYNACLIIMDNFGCASDECHQVIIQESQNECHAAFVADQIGTTLEVEFADQSTSNHDIISWHWTFGDGSESDLHNPHHTYDEPGTYLVCLVITDNAGCVSDICHEVVVEGAPTDCNASFEWEQAANSLQVHFFDNSDDDPDIVSWSWNFGDGHFSDDPNPVHIYDEPGTYTVCLIVQNEFGCVADICHQVVVESAQGECNAIFEWEQEANSLEVHFFDNSDDDPDIVSWYWSFGDGHFSDDANPTHVYEEPGTYTVCLIVENEFGCVADVCHQVVVEGSQGDCSAAFEWDEVGNTGEVLFFDNSDDDPDIVSWHWSFGDGHFSDDANPSHTYVEPGFYTVCLIVENEFGCVADICHQVTVGSVSECGAGFQYTVELNSFEVHFTDFSDDDPDIVSWHWTFGDGSESDDQHPTHVYNEAGVYLVCLYVTNELGCESHFCQEIIVGDPEEGCHAAFEWEQFENSFQVHFINHSTSENDIISYTWHFGDGSTGDGQNPNHTYDHAGTYIVCLRIEDNTGCVSEICHEVTVEGSQEECHAAFGFDIVPNTLEVHFYDHSDDDPDIISWHWNFGDNHFSEDQNPIHVYAEPGTYVVCLVVVNEFGCASDVCHEVTVGGSSEDCNASFDWEQFENTTEIHFINYSTSDHDIISYHWTFGDGHASDDASPNHNYEEPGTYVVCLRIEDNTGCVSEICHEVTVAPEGGFQAEFTFFQMDNPMNITFSGSGTGNHVIVAWFWDFGDGQTSTEQYPVHVFAHTGTYTVCLTVTDIEGNQATNCHNLTVINDNDLCDASYKFFTDHSGNTIVFKNASEGITDHSTYRWEFGDGTISTEENPDHAYTKPGIYTVCLFVTDTTTGCSSHFCHSLTYHLRYKDLNQDANIENEQAHDTKYNRSAGGVNIIRYTNPVRDHVDIEFVVQQAGDVFIEVYDIMGNRKYTREYIHAEAGIHNVTLQHDALQPGMYSIVIRAGEHVASKVVTVVN